MGPLVDSIVVPIYTDYCAPDAQEIVEEVRVQAETTPDIQWEVLCYRDGMDPDYLNVKLSWALDPSDDFWEVWYVRTTVDSITYGQEDIPGAEVTLNTRYPASETRIAPRTLTEGDYLLQVDAIRGELLTTDPQTGLPNGVGTLDTTSGRVRVHVVADTEG